MNTTSANEWMSDVSDLSLKNRRIYTSVLQLTLEKLRAQCTKFGVRSGRKNKKMLARELAIKLG